MKLITRNNILIAFAMVVMLFNTSLYAQKDTIYNENVIINVGFNPIVSDATKINVNPSIFDSSFSSIDLQFDKIDKGYNTHLQFDTIRPAKVKGEPQHTLYKINIKAGLGMAFSKKIGNGFVPRVQASYTSLRNRHLVYGADFYTSSIIGGAKDYGHAGYSNNAFNLWGKKIFDSYSATSRIYYTYDRHYYYGSKLYEELANNLGDNAKDFSKKDYKNSLHNIGFDLAYTKLKRDNSLQHNAVFSLNYSTGYQKARELDLHFNGDISKKFSLWGASEQTLGLNFDYRHAFFKFNDNYIYPTVFDNNLIYTKYSLSRALFNLTPYIVFDYDKFHFNASLLFVAKHNGYNNFQMLPSATVNFELIENMLSLYGGFKSAAVLPSLYEMYRENPYIVSSALLQDEAYEDLFAKFIVTFSSNIQLSVQGGIMSMKNHHFFYNTILPMENILNAMNIDYANAKKYYATLTYDMNITPDFNVALSSTFQNVKRSDDVLATYQPKFLASLNAKYTWNDKLNIVLSPTFKSKQKSLYLGQERELKAIMDINLNVSYDYSDTWSFFIDVENLAMQSYQRYFNYPVYNFIGVIGARYHIN